MTSEENYREYYDVLELSPGASPAEVREAYVHLRELYSSESFVMSPLDDELSAEWKDEVVGRIEEAYSKLSELFQKTAPSGSKKQHAHFGALKEEVKSIRIFNGGALRHLREKLGVELHELARATKISKYYLEKIEEEDFAVLPERVYLRGYIINYAKQLSLDPDRVAGDYMSLHSAWEKSTKGT